MKKTFLLLMFIAIGYANAQDLKPVKLYGPIITNKISDQYIPAYYQNIGGLLGYRMQMNLEKRLLQIDSVTLLSGFERHV